MSFQFLKQIINSINSCFHAISYRSHNKLKRPKTVCLWFFSLRHVMAGKKQHNVRRRPNSLASSTGNVSKFGHDYSKDYANTSWPYRHGKMDCSAKLVLIVVPVVMISAICYVWYSAHLKSVVNTALDTPKIISQEMTSNNLDRFWGTYRSSLYFGLKTRNPKSPVAGLMWMTQFTGELPPPVRHWCEHGDKLPMYGWFAHDGVNFGLQELVDQYYSLTTDFVRRPGGQQGGDWTAHIHASPRPSAEEVVMSLFFYMALDGQGQLEAVIKKDRLVAIRGFSEELQNFQLSFPHPSSAAKMNYLVTRAPGLAQLKETLMRGMRMQSWDKTKNAEYVALGGRMMPNDAASSDPNFIVYQVTVQLPFRLEVQFESGSFADRPEPLTGELYQRQISQHLANFDKRFEDIFQLQAKGFSEEKTRFARAALSNMIGSIGYFHGSSLVQSKYNPEPVAYWQAPLFTAVPSRSFFPRGFLWDEGFHNLLLSKWDQTLSMDIIGHWLDLLNTEGWIPREQILGSEARAKVPAEFVVQNNQNANPPTLFLPLQAIVRKLAASDRVADKLYLQSLYPRLKTWYNWFNSTQTGVQRTAYRWKGRDEKSIKELNPKTLSSGLDDYPRASHPTSAERHVDLRCWMALASSVMVDISRALNESTADYQATYDMLSDNSLLDALHWSEDKQRYSDYGLHTNQVKLERPKPKQPAPGQRPQPQDKVRVVKQAPQYQLVDSHYGYVSLFPFLLKIVQPDSLKLGKILADLQDPSLLWTKFGLRSLSKTSPLYNKHNTEHDPPYWRGSIWININYLAVGALYHYSNQAGPYQDIAHSVYTDLRNNIVENIYQQYRSTGYIWEQYDDNTGQGKGTHPFTGWSALVVAIMAEQY